MSLEADALDPMARIIFQTALREGQAGELLWRLFNGDGVTIDLHTRQLVYLPANIIEQLTHQEHE